MQICDGQSWYISGQLADSKDIQSLIRQKVHLKQMNLSVLDKWVIIFSIEIF